MRLIDADELTNKFLGYYTEKERQGDVTFSACEIKQGFADMVEEAPTINPEDLRPKGKWIPSEFGFPDRSKKCSRCGEYEEPRTEKKKPFPDYCPNCGAKMEG